MKWLGRRGSGNIDDRRGMGGGGLALGGGGILVIILGLLFGEDATQLLGQLPLGEATQQEGKSGSPSDDAGKFADVVLADTDALWTSIFEQKGSSYERPTIVLFDNSVSSACGSASSATGPFYCPTDKKIYLDLTFQEELKNRFGAGGDFPMAYVIAHEIGHHVQNLLGIEESFRARQSRVSTSEKNRLSVLVELQADCFAGLWAKHTQQTKNVLEAGDIEEALGAASAVGDDKLQKASRGEVVPDSFTHGSSEQRMRAFQAGFSKGDLQTCLMITQSMR